MSGKDLFEGMSFVDERFVDEAENKTIPKTKASPWFKVVALAACLCLIVLSIYNRNQFLNRGKMEGLTGESAADQAWPGEGVASEIEMESAVQPPEDGPTGEVLSVILRVEEMTELGFTGTVAELLDTDIFEIGMELNVIIAEGIRNETADGNPAASEDAKVNLTGTYVMVQFIEYNKDAQTILINRIQEVIPPEDIP